MSDAAPPPEGGDTEPPATDGRGSPGNGRAPPRGPRPTNHRRKAPKTARPRSSPATATALRGTERTMALPDLDKIIEFPGGTIPGLNLGDRLYRDVLYFPRPAPEPDPLAARALYTVAGALRKLEGITDPVAEARRRVQEEGLSLPVSELTQKLRGASLERSTQFLLATPGVYPWLLLVAMDEDRVKPEDVAGLFNSVVRNAGGEPRQHFARALVEAVAADQHLSLTPAVAERIVDALAVGEVSLSPGGPQAAIVALLKRVTEDGSLPALVENFATLGEIDPQRFTPAVKAAMVDYLKRLGVRAEPGQDPKRYDEYMALAYQAAVQASDGSANDPLDAARRRGTTSWNFEVDTFESEAEQAVARNNILAAGALDYVYVLGEAMGIFRLVDALVLKWAVGSLDVAEGPTAGKLYRFWKLRGERSSPEERGMLYKRVLDRGDGQTLSAMVVNEHFPRLWGALMQEVAKYIEKTEGGSAGITVSRAPLYQATRQLQYNLSEHMTGMAHMQVTEMYAHLREAMEILGSPELVDRYGDARRASVWSVIANASREEFDAAPDISALRTAAVDGNRIFHWLADFDRTNVRDEDFRAFLGAAEAWILAQAGAEESYEPAGVGADNGDGGEEAHDDWDD